MYMRLISTITQVPLLKAFVDIHLKRSQGHEVVRISDQNFKEFILLGIRIKDAEEHASDNF